MNIYVIRQSYDNNYTNHQMLKELFEGSGKLLWQKNGNSIITLTDINLSDKFKDDIGIEFIGNSENYLTHILDNQVSFTIRINNCKSNNGKHIVVNENLDQWFDNKLCNIGCDIITKNIKNEGIIMSLKNNQKIYHASIFVSGTMTVRDLSLLQDAIHNGIGRGKAFGFGLLNVFSL